MIGAILSVVFLVVTYIYGAVHLYYDNVEEFKDKNPHNERSRRYNDELEVGYIMALAIYSIVVLPIFGFFAWCMFHYL